MTHSGKILLVDDEETIRLTVSATLENRGLSVLAAGDAAAGLALLDANPFDLAILDLKLPGAMDGIGLMNEIRARSPETVIIMISAFATLDSAIVALRQGAHDYLLKPFTMAQLVESVQAGLTKRREPHLQSFSEFGIRIDRGQRVVYCNGSPVVLSATEFDMLVHLFEHSDRIVTASELMRAVQGYDMDERDARTIVRVHIQRIRQKIGDDPENPRFIRNVRAKGYRFVG